MDDLEIYLAILVVSYMACFIVEKGHYKRIHYRESLVKDVEIHSNDETSYTGEYVICTGNVVLAVSYFKVFIASIVNFFGGEMSAIASVLDRARREAILRMIENNPKAKVFVNLRFEFVEVAPGLIEAHAYSTGIFE